MTDSPTVARDEFFDSVLGDFLDESGQLLDRLNADLLQLDEWVRNCGGPSAAGHCDDQLLNDMFRSAHSLKGLSAMLGLDQINSLTHKVENVFDAARKDELAIDGDVVELIFQAIDRLGCLVEAIKEPNHEAVECQSIVEGIGELLRSAGAERARTSQADADRALQEQPAAAAAPLATDYFAGLEDGESSSKYLPIFIDETGLSLDQLTATLLATEAGGSPETVANLLIVSHRIKGSAASIGLNRAAKLAHLMEDLLQQLVDGGRALTAPITDAMLACTDGLRQYVEGLKQGKASTAAFPSLAEALLVAGQTTVASDAASAQDDVARPQQAVQAAAVVVPTAPAAVAPPAPAATDNQVATSARSAGVSPQIHAQVAVVAHDLDATLVGEVFFQSDLPLVGLKARLIYEKLAAAGEVHFFQPPPETLDDLEDLRQVTFGVATGKTADALRKLLQIAGVEHVVVERLVAASVAKNIVPALAAASAPVAAAAAAATPRAQRPAEKSRTSDNAKPAETVRVDIERLDHLMNLAGQLVINKAHFAQLGDTLKGALGNRRSSQVLGRVLGTLEKMSSSKESSGERLRLEAENAGLRAQARCLRHDLEMVRRDVETLGQVRGALNELFETIHQLDRVSDGIQQSVMDTRMLPIGPLFTRFNRVIRDITRSNGKSIRLAISGEKTELDKRMIDELSDPLIHMVRNSADHGIESPEVRAAAGKPRQGTVTLDAFHRGNCIIIRVSDDGAGLDAERIRRKAVQRGLIGEADAEKMTLRQVHQLIWEPGLSTAEKVTEVSGRGMGMDIVKSKIEELNGTVDLDSEPGRGTTMTIKLPLTLAILPSLMVQIDGDVFAMPLESVAEIVRVQPQDLSTVHGQWTACVRGRVISLVRLRDVFAWHDARAGVADSVAEGATLVVISQAGGEIALRVDCVLGEEDIVIKSMAENFRNVPGIAGASILGDGRVSLIIDPAAVLDMAKKCKEPSPI